MHLLDYPFSILGVREAVELFSFAAAGVIASIVILVAALCYAIVKVGALIQWTRFKLKESALWYETAVRDMRTEVSKPVLTLPLGHFTFED